MSMASIDTRYIEGQNGVSLAVDFGGRQDAPGVVFLHGGGQTRHAWRRAAQSLIKAGFRVAGYDLRGHGDSEWAADADYRLDTQIGDLRAVVREFRSPPVVIGASMGGLIALTAVGESGPGFASALVLVDVTPRVDPAGEARIIEFMQAHRDGFTSVEEAAAAIARYRGEPPRTGNLDGLRRNLRQRDGRWYWHWDPRLFDTWDTRSEGTVERFISAARRMAVPTLLVRGAESDLVYPEHAEEFLTYTPGARWIDVSGTHHMIVGDRNDSFTTSVMDFLQEIGAAPPANTEATTP